MFSEITVTELGEKLKSDEKFILLDVRELSELEHASKSTDATIAGFCLELASKPPF